MMKIKKIANDYFGKMSVVKRHKGMEKLSRKEVTVRPKILLCDVNHFT